MIVDYERARTNKTWLPRRLGCGKGDTRKARQPRHIIEARDTERYGNDSGGGGFRGEDRSYLERSTHSRERSIRHDSREREDCNGGSDLIIMYFVSRYCFLSFVIDGFTSMK